jgi:glutathione S-transferase
MFYRYTALITLLMLVTYIWTAANVSRARSAHGVKAPATEGPDAFNRVYRAHVNTLEQLVLMLPALWICAVYVGDLWAGLLGLAWVVGRVLYVTSYSADAEKRGLGFMIGFFALVAAIVASLGAIIFSMLK